MIRRRMDSARPWSGWRRTQGAGLTGVLILLCILLPAGCGVQENEPAAAGQEQAAVEESSAALTWESFAEEKDAQAAGDASSDGSTAAEPTEAEAGTAENEKAGPDSAGLTESDGEAETENTEDQLLVVLDPGHTAHVSGGTEPNGPGSTEMKDKDTLGTKGISTGLPEYELNLSVCTQLRQELEDRNYRVILTHETNDTEMSCIERAQVANDNDADLFLRVHADGSTSSAAQGAMTISITENNPYHPELYQESYQLSDIMIRTYCSVTGRKSRGVWQTDTMTGSNWSEVPCTLIEMGFMTNAEEDVWMASEEGQKLIVQGIADGVDEYFAQRSGEEP